MPFGMMSQREFDMLHSNHPVSENELLFSSVNLYRKWLLPGKFALSYILSLTEFLWDKHLRDTTCRRALRMGERVRGGLEVEGVLGKRQGKAR